MKEIPLTHGYVALVDDEDYDWLMQWKWHLTKQGYAGTRAGKTQILMHRLITRAAKGQEVDHKNLNKLNNQRSNIRVCTPAQNKTNRTKQINIKKPARETMQYGYSKFKGVCRHQKKWRARIKVGDKKIHIGLFATAEEAARAYDHIAFQHFGEFARLNFPEDYR